MAREPISYGGLFPSERSDEELVESCRVELPYRTDAYEQLLRRYESVVFRSCLRYLRREEEAEEACQDAFIRVFHGLSRFEGRSSFRTWLFRIVHNICLRRRAQLATRSKKTDEAREMMAGSMVSMDPRVEPPGKASVALEKLSENDRTAIVLRYVAEMSFEEIADVLDLSLSATKMRVYRATERYRAAFLKLGRKD